MRLRIKWAVFGLVVGILLAAIAFLSSRSIIRNASPARTLDASAVVHEIQRLNDLVSVKYTVQRVVGLEEKKVPALKREVTLVRAS